MSLAMHVVWDFTFEPRPSDVEQLHDTGARLRHELRKLARRHADVVGPTVSTEARRGAIVVELVATGPDDNSALQRALDVVRAAIHAMRDAVPGPAEVGRALALEFRTGTVIASRVRTGLATA
jgi:hypothetical protein